jgi:DNA-directed RNA polymerase specialized sigma24 family protein
MREDEPAAWSEFIGRFGPLLDRYARVIGVPNWYRQELVSDVLDDAALRLPVQQHAPRKLSSYLCSALYHRLLKTRRAAARRDRAYRASVGALDSQSPTASDYAIRMSASPLTISEPACISAMSRLATLISTKLSADERQLLEWHAALVPRREIALWLGITYEAAKKRVARACDRAKTIALQVSRELGDEDRAAVTRFLERTGAPARRKAEGG